MAAYFDADPAHDLLVARARHAEIPLTELALAIGLPKRTLHRVLASRWLRWDIADRVAIALGHHPCELWPDWFDLNVDFDTKEQAS